MESEMMVVLVVGISLFTFLAFVKILSDNRVRNRLIEKGLVDENVKFLYSDRMALHVPSALKWGLVLIGVGAAFLVGQLSANYPAEITVGCMFLFGGLGLVLYYILGSRIIKKSGEN